MSNAQNKPQTVVSPLDSSAAPASGLTHRKTLLKSGALNLFTKILPILIGIFAVPVMIHGFGVERFGVLTIIWSIVGYATVFDAGIGRALTQLVSKRLGDNDIEHLPRTITTALVLSVGIGSLAALCMLLGAPWLIGVLKISGGLQQEAAASVRWLAFSLPFLIGNIAITGVLESYQRFGLINLLRLPIVFCNFIAPVLLLWFMPQWATLPGMVAVIALGRVAVFLLLLAVLPQVLNGFYSRLRAEASHFKTFMANMRADASHLIRFGKWVTVTNLLGPLMTYFDRFLIANVFSAAVVAYYTTPYDLMSRAKTLPEAALPVLFPAFSSELASNPERAGRMYRKSHKLMALATVLPAIALVFFVPTLLTLWVGEAFAQKSIVVTQVLMFAFVAYINSQLCMALVQASGRSELTAGWVIAQSVFYLPFLWGAVFLLGPQFGLVVPAVCLLFKFSMDWVFYAFMSERLIQAAIAAKAQAPAVSAIRQPVSALDVPAGDAAAGDACALR
ncbi:MAG: oligosaccharide flippase family protein [Vampirovibrionales bacterium]|nr:oligosaccharide flippase family protein [Vampirovibrionales bacterium]